MLKEQDLRGAAKHYESLPSHEKESIDRQFADITRDVERHEESRIKSADSDWKNLAKEVGTHCYRQIVNPGWFVMPSKCGGNEIKEEQMSEEERIIEKIVRKVVYEMTIEQAIEFLKDKIDISKVKGA